MDFRIKNKQNFTSLIEDKIHGWYSFELTCQSDILE